MRHPDGREPDGREPETTEPMMGHPDEGTIHEWLDGALAADAAAPLERHVAACAACAAAVAEARGFIAASSRIVGALDVAPRGVIPAAPTSAPVAAGEPDVEPAAVPPSHAGVLPLRPRPVGATGPARRRLLGWPARAAAVALLAVGTWAVVERGGLEEAGTLAADRAVLAELDEEQTVAASDAGAPLPAPGAAAPGGAAASAPADPRRVVGAAAPEVVVPDAAADAADFSGRPVPRRPAASPVPQAGAGAADAARKAGSAPAPGAAAAASPAAPPPPSPPSIVAGAAARAARPAPGGERIIAGSVVAEGSGRPVVGAVVTATGGAASTVTDTAGRFALRARLEIGQAVAVERLGFAPATVRLPAAVGDTARVAIALQPSAEALTLAQPTAAPVPARAGCYRVTLGRAPAAARSAAAAVEGTLRGWIRLGTEPAADGWHAAAPVAGAPMAAGAAPRWREREDGGVEVEWPAGAAPLRLRLREGSGGLLAGTATHGDAAAAVPVTLRPAPCPER